MGERSARSRQRPRESILPSLGEPAPGLDVRWLARGGHVGFPPGSDLGLPGRGVWAQVLEWLDQQD